MDASARFALVAGILVTAIYSVGLIERTRRQIPGMGVDSLRVLRVYLASMMAFHNLRQAAPLPFAGLDAPAFT